LAYQGDISSSVSQSLAVVQQVAMKKAVLVGQEVAVRQIAATAVH
jgi:hypothetical protein